jgi:hypothetical protein
MEGNQLDEGIGRFPPMGRHYWPAGAWMPPGQYQSLIDVGSGEVHAVHEGCREKAQLP